MAESAAYIKTTMDAMEKYLDRLYFTAQFQGNTVGCMAAVPGFPIWNHYVDGILTVGAAARAYSLFEAL